LRIAKLLPPLLALAALGAAPQTPLFVDVTCTTQSIECVRCAFGIEQCLHQVCTDGTTPTVCGSCQSSCAE